MSLIVSRSSGNAAADRRFAWGVGASAAGEHAEAAELFAQTLEIAPGFAAAAFAQGLAWQECGDADAAARGFRLALKLDPRDEQGAALHLARMGAGAVPPAAPQAYVRELFDAYAPGFDAHLSGALGYRAPQVLLDMVLETRWPQPFPGQGQPLTTILDLGCGTGLSGAAFRKLASHLTGVDLSPGMIALAQAKGIYDRLAVADIAGFLDGEPPASAGLILAADVFVYIGELAGIFRACCLVLPPGGILAFTVQKSDESITFGEDMRYGHSVSYITQTARAAGLTVRSHLETSTRRDRGRDVRGLCFVLVRAE